jgi:hypothetical protein
MSAGRALVADRGPDAPAVLVEVADQDALDDLLDGHGAMPVMITPLRSS